MNNMDLSKVENGFSDVDNILWNLSGGLLPENLSEVEIKLLTEKYGENWFEVLGYTEPEFKKP